MGFRHQYVIGDIQGCYADLQALLKQIGFDERTEIEIQPEMEEFL